AKGLEADDRVGTEIDDGLVDDGNQLLRNQLSKETDKPNQAFLLTRVSFLSQRHCVVGAQAHGRSQAETEFPVSHVNDVAVDQRDLVDSLAVGKGSIGAAEITHQVPTGILSDEGVVFGDLVGVD